MTKEDFQAEEIRLIRMLRRDLGNEINAHWRTKAVLQAVAQYVPSDVTPAQIQAAAQDILDRMVMETPTSKTGPKEAHVAPDSGGVVGAADQPIQN